VLFNGLAEFKSKSDEWQDRVVLEWAFDSGQLREGAKSTGRTGGCPSPDLGTSPQRHS